MAMSVMPARGAGGKPALDFTAHWRFDWANPDAEVHAKNSAWERINSGTTGQLQWKCKQAGQFQMLLGGGNKYNAQYGRGIIQYFLSVKSAEGETKYGPVASGMTTLSCAVGDVMSITTDTRIWYFASDYGSDTYPCVISVLKV